MMHLANFTPRSIVIAALLLSACLTAGDATVMLAKAQLAQLLIKRSWDTTASPPWPWADTHPVARLVIPAIKHNSYVLNGATGAVLAFGPGMVSGSAIPGNSGVTMIAAHRDTHFELLKNIAHGSLIRLQNNDKQWLEYRVTSTRVADSRVESFEPDPLYSRLVLVTCYPFDALIPGGPLRFVVEAELLTSSAAASKDGDQS